MNEIDLIDPGALSKLPRPAAGGGNRLVFLVLNQLIGFHAEFLQLLGHRSLQFSQIHHGQRGSLAAALLCADVHEVIGDQLSHLNRGHADVVAQPVQPVRIIPADAGLRFLAGNHIVRVLAEHDSVFHRRHQAGVEAHEIKLHPGVFERRVDARQRHGAAAVLFIVAIARNRSAAVIPQDELHPVGREMLRAIADEAGQGVRIRHGIAAHVLLQTVQRSVTDLINLIDRTADDIVPPPPAATRKDDQIHLIAELRLGHLLQIRRTHAVLAFQIRAAQIDQNGDRILLSAQNPGELFPGLAGHRFIQRGGGAGGLGDRNGSLLGSRRPSEKGGQRAAAQIIGRGFPRGKEGTQQVAQGARRRGTGLRAREGQRAGGSLLRLGGALLSHLGDDVPQIAGIRQAAAVKKAAKLSAAQEHHQRNDDHQELAAAATAHARAARGAPRGPSAGSGAVHPSAPAGLRRTAGMGAASALLRTRGRHAGKGRALRGPSRLRGGTRAL